MKIMAVTFPIHCRHFPLLQPSLLLSPPYTIWCLYFSALWQYLCLHLHPYQPFYTTPTTISLLSMPTRSATASLLYSTLP